MLRRRRAASSEVLIDVTATAKELIPGVDTAGVLLIGKAGKYEIVWRARPSCRTSSTTCR